MTLREVEGRHCSVTVARSCGPGVAHTPLEGQPCQHQLSFPRRLLGFWAWQGWGAWEAGIQARGDANNTLQRLL